jgi:hypothetical protein
MKRAKRSIRARTSDKPRRRAARPVRDALLAPIKGADRRVVGQVRAEIVRAGNGRVKRLVYPPGFRWSRDMKPLVGTDSCMHAHVGFLARGRIRGAYADGCAFAASAPQVLAIEPGHDAWVVGPDPVVLIEFDAEGATAARFGFPEQHRHDRPGRAR